MVCIVRFVVVEAELEVVIAAGFGLLLVAWVGAGFIGI